MWGFLGRPTYIKSLWIFVKNKITLLVAALGVEGIRWYESKDDLQKVVLGIASTKHKSLFINKIL